MSFLGWPAEEKVPSRRTQLRRRRIARALLDKFGSCFPDVTYDLHWESRTINAQACRFGAVRHVTIYGGLVRHHAMTGPGLALTIAHETGHHLGGLPRDPEMPWMAWQGQADYWAARTAMPLVFGSRDRNTTLRGARQILQLHEDLFAASGGPDLSAVCRYFIFRAGASGSEIPLCAQAAYRRSFGQKQPRT
jgi:hypothetical protein